MSGGGSIETARNVPERDSEAKPGGQEGRSNEPAMLVKPELIEQNRVLRQMEEDADNREQWYQRRGHGLGVERYVTEERDTAKNLIRLKLSERNRGDKPGTLRNEGDEQDKSNQVVGTDGLGSALRWHDVLTYFVTFVR